MELSAESVSSLLELADLLVDLQAFARTELEEHESAVRALDLTQAMVAEAKEDLDLISEAIAAVLEIASDRVLAAFDASSTASANAANQSVQQKIESDRTLLIENLALALARHLRSSANEESRPSSSQVPSAEIEGTMSALESPDFPAMVAPSEKRRKQPVRSTGKEVASSDDFVGRIIARLNKKGPDAIADAILSAVTSTIKHSPKSIPALAGLVYANFIGSGVVLAAGGGFSLTLAWIAYELWKRKTKM